MKRAVDHFGGEAQARRKMTHALRAAFGEVGVAQLLEMEEAYRLKPDTLVALVLGRGGDDMADYPLFEALAPSVNLSIHDVLGRPELTPDDEAYWAEEMRQNPLHMLGSASNAGMEPRALKLPQYLVSRAIEELNNTKGSLHSVLVF